MYVILFCLSVTQTVCLLCDILFIFWSLKEEVDIEIHQKDGKDGKRLSTKIQLLNRFLPCCFSIPTGPTPDNNRQSNVALSDIFSASDPDSSQINAITDSDPSDPKTWTRVTVCSCEESTGEVLIILPQITKFV